LEEFFDFGRANRSLKSVVYSTKSFSASAKKATVAMRRLGVSSWRWRASCHQAGNGISGCAGWVPGARRTESLL